MKRFELIAMLLLSCCSAIAQQAPRFLGAIPDDLLSKPEARAKVAEDQFYEVAASKLPRALALLGNTDFVVLPYDENAGHFAHGDTGCKPPRRLLLLRATYVNGGTGSFALYWQGSSLIVGHASLGTPTEPRVSALVACLNRSPVHLYAWVDSGIE